jgi:glycerol-3-phosphate acyltransferase PlsY
MARVSRRQGGRHRLRRADRRRLAGRAAGRRHLAAFALAPVLALLLADRATALLAVAIAILVFASHHENIRRLLAGTEPRIGSKA